MAKDFYELNHTWLVHGKPVTPMTDEDVFELIRDNVCDDCADYVREMFDPEAVKESVLENLTDAEILNEGYCTGECDKVQKTQEHYENLLKEVRELASEIYHKIVDDWNPGTRRTKKEQFAVDKVIEIINLVNKNT